MKLSKKRTWKVPHPQSDPSPQYPPQPRRHDDDSEAKDSYVKVCVFYNFLFSKGLSDTRATELFNLLIEKHGLAVYQVKPCPRPDGSMTGDIL